MNRFEAIKNLEDLRNRIALMPCENKAIEEAVMALKEGNKALDFRKETMETLLEGFYECHCGEKSDYALGQAMMFIDLMSFLDDKWGNKG